MDNWIQWAFAQELKLGEKLVLVWLAGQVGAAGVARLDREALAKATGYQSRSLQRALKDLRDADLFRDNAGWFCLGPNANAALPPTADLPAAGEIPELAGKALKIIGMLSQAEVDEAGEAIAKAITEAADAHLVRLTDVNLRLLQGLELMAQRARIWEDSVAARELAAVPPEPPPDPVLVSTYYRELVSSGFLTEAEAYGIAKKRLEDKAEVDAVDVPAAGRVPMLAPLIHKGNDTAKPVGVVSPHKVEYLDSALGRFEKIRDILDPSGGPWADAMTVWQRLEDAENKHTVAGEMPAFELLYPAIVMGARRWAGKITLADFLDEKAIAANRAPWDFAPAGLEVSEAHLNADIDRMAGELERASHPMCQLTDRTVEKGEDGITRTESVAAYHTRVLRIYQQLKKLQEMGV